MPKLSIDNQGRVRAYLQNLSTIYGVHIICTVCMYCCEWINVKDGKGVFGVSHGICPRCMAKKPWLATGDAEPKDETEGE